MNRGTIIAVVALIALAAAGCRSITPNEEVFLGSIYRPKSPPSARLNTEVIRIWTLTGNRSNAIVGAREMIEEELRSPQTRRLLRGMDSKEFIRRVEEKIASTADGVVIGNLIYLRPGVYLPDLAVGWPGFATGDLFLFAHEVLHVWQHQNRRLTGYSLIAAMLEHLKYDDPYYYVIEPGRRFLAYRFEQQGKMMQDFATLRFTAPNSPEYRALRALIREVFDPDEFLDAVSRLRTAAAR